jgi:hypothetical protein
MTNRKIVQFSILPASTALSQFVYAPCEDGTMWFTIAGFDVTGEYQWQRVPQAIPDEP